MKASRCPVMTCPDVVAQEEVPRFGGATGLGAGAPTTRRHSLIPGTSGNPSGLQDIRLRRDGCVRIGGQAESCRGSDGDRASPRCPSSSPPDPSVRRSVRQILGGRTHCRSGGRKDIRSFKAFDPVNRSAKGGEGVANPPSPVPVAALVSACGSPPTGSCGLRRPTRNSRQVIRIAVISCAEGPACGLSHKLAQRQAHRQEGADQPRRGRSPGAVPRPIRARSLALWPQAARTSRFDGKSAQAGLVATFDVNCRGRGAPQPRVGSG